MIVALYTTTTLLLAALAWMCFRMANLHERLASAYRLIADLIDEDDAERRVLLSEAERQRIEAAR